MAHTLKKKDTAYVGTLTCDLGKVMELSMCRACLYCQGNNFHISKTIVAIIVHKSLSVVTTIVSWNAIEFNYRNFDCIPGSLPSLFCVGKSQSPVLLFE
jgi:hypothetical protein